MNYQEIYIKIGNYIFSEYMKHPRFFTTEHPGYVIVMGDVYNFLVGENLMMPLENLPLHEKNNLWRTVKDSVDDSVSKKMRIEICKFQLAINYYDNL